MISMFCCSLCLLGICHFTGDDNAMSCKPVPLCKNLVSSESLLEAWWRVQEFNRIKCEINRSKKKTLNVTVKIVFVVIHIFLFSLSH